MKKYLVVVLAMLTLTGCGVDTAAASTSPTPTPTASASAYVAVMRTASVTLQKDLDATQTDCGASNEDACYSDMQTLSDDVHRAQDSLKGVSVPPCLKTVDASLRTALQLLDKSAQTAMQGLQQNDSFLMDTAGSYMTQAGRYLGDANTDLTSAKC